MPMLHRSKCIVVSISLVLVILLATSCAPAATPIPTPPPTEPAAVATPTPAEEEIPTPTAEVVPEEALYLPEVPRITCEELKQLMDEGTDFVLVDNRFEDSFQRGRITGAINIPYTPLPPLTEEMITQRLLALPRDKLIVLYCDWPEDSESAGAALELIEAGYEDVKALRKGWYRWLELGYPTE